MKYDELKKIAQPHIREGGKLPSNALLLLVQLHIPYKTEKQCDEDYGDKMNPLYNAPAFLSVDATGKKTAYFNTAAKYWNFYIFHEIAHFLLGHESNSPQNEIDADMLACILAAPIENLPSHLKSARDLSSLCQIPIDKAEMYWQEIKKKFFRSYKTIALVGSIFILVVLSTCLFPILNAQDEKVNPVPQAQPVATPFNSPKLSDVNSTYYKTASGIHYHRANCQHIKYKTNVISLSVEEISKFSLIPCEECIK